MATRYYTASSLDGFIADERHSLDWLFEVEGGDAEDTGAAEFFAGIGAIAMGASTYRWLLDHENLVAEPERWRSYYGETPLWVFTHREPPAIPGIDMAFVQGDVAVVHEEMTRRAGGRDVWLAGGGDLVGQFADAGLLDEILVTYAPATLGAGAPLLPRRLTRSRLELVDVTRRGQFAQLTYRVGPPL